MTHTDVPTHGAVGSVRRLVAVLALLAVVATTIWFTSGPGAGPVATATAAPVDPTGAVSDLLREQVTSVMRGCVDEVLPASGDAALRSPHPALNLADEEALVSCASRTVAALAPGWGCTGEGCYREDGTGYSWDAPATEWVCEHHSHEFCDLPSERPGSGPRPGTP